MQQGDEADVRFEIDRLDEIAFTRSTGRGSALSNRDEHSMAYVRYDSASGNMVIVARK